MTRSIILAVIAVGVFLATSCREELVIAEGEHDGGSDTDTDTDSDSDVDTETDTYPESDCVRFVNVEADSGGDGLSWGSAFTAVQPAIDSAAEVFADTEEPCQVWVAAGTYYVYESSREDTIALATGVSLLGGFTGSESAVSERNWRVNVTVLDGHDGPSQEHQVYHVVFSDGDGVIDGFAITGGRADSQNPEGADVGGGMLLVTGEALVANCLLAGNYAMFEGSAISVGFGGGGSSTVPERHPTIVGCTFTDNIGRALVSSAASPTISKCLFFANPNGAVLIDDSQVAITSCTFADNGDDYGSAIDFTGAAPYSCPMSNIVAWDSYGEPLHDQESIFMVSHSNIRGGFAGEGNIDADPLFVDPEGGDFRLQAGSPCIDAADGPGAPEFDIDGYPRVDDPDAPNTGIGPPWADMGAYECQL